MKRVIPSLLLALALASPAWGQPGFFISPPSTTCANDVRLTAPVAGQSLCYDSTTGQINGFNTAWAPVGPAISVAAYGAKGDGIADDTASIQAAMDAAAARATGAITRGSVVFPAGTYRITATLQIQQQALDLGGADGAVIRWDGNNTTPMLQIVDSTGVRIHDLVMLGKTASPPTAAIYYAQPVASLIGTNEFLNVQRVSLGRRYTQDTLTAGAMARGIWIGGASNTNNDQFAIRDVQIHDATTAGIAIDNAQSIWGVIENVFLNACGYGIYTGSNVLIINPQFNRNTTADLHAFRDIQVDVFGFNSEHAVVPIETAQGANVSITGGKIVVGTEVAGTSWANLLTAGRIAITNLLAVESGVSGKLLTLTGSSAARSELIVRNSSLPGGDDGSGFNISGVGAVGIFVDIQHGPYRARKFIAGSGAMPSAPFESPAVFAVATWVITNVDAGTDVITISTNHQFYSGQAVVFVQTGGGDPGGLATGTVYYVIYVSPTTLSLATSLANALAGTAIDITSAGSGTLHLLTAGQQGFVTLAAAASTTVYNAAVTTSSTVVFSPTNAAAATLVSGASSPYVTVSPGALVLHTADGAPAAGTETFRYWLVN